MQACIPIPMSGQAVPVGSRSSGVEHSLGKGEVDSSNPSASSNLGTHKVIGQLQILLGWLALACWMPAAKGKTGWQRLYSSAPNPT